MSTMKTSLLKNVGKKIKCRIKHLYGIQGVQVGEVLSYDSVTGDVELKYLDNLSGVSKQERLKESALTHVSSISDEYYSKWLKMLEVKNK